MAAEKNERSSFLDGATKSFKGSKVIDTPNLYIEGNIMMWEGNILQLSNVVNISIVPQGLLGFPFWTLFLILVGIGLFQVNILLALISFVITGGVIYFWYKRNKELRTQAHLILNTNSGKEFSFLFGDRAFLKRVFDVLAAIIVDGPSVKGGIDINISNNQIHQGASILKDMKLKLR